MGCTGSHISPTGEPTVTNVAEDAEKKVRLEAAILARRTAAEKAAAMATLPARDAGAARRRGDDADGARCALET